ncbi:hypothetical protein [Sporosalibacterium faouarense]|uniref:hypothetical protein n=1 Tax=Sporosalibacterium faouarense TaxID=516123 RepID=UPI00192C9C41|nr:hypothetical protein [Sporosalibacterium faouarense]
MAEIVIRNVVYIFFCILSLDVLMIVFKKFVYFAMTMFNHVDLSFFKRANKKSFTFKKVRGD